MFANHRCKHFRWVFVRPAFGYGSTPYPPVCHPRMVPLSVCGLLAWVASLSQYPLREKQMQQHSAHSGFALFPLSLIHI
ncbi:Uncharacterized protein DBV15_04303 [Temnothorax longispinosus]|uniref:Uncharacterized protein n=1 Tax=Temnothorax longispinosus TaxID=300112 RepID=A0A4S2KYF6_9HYME|nr:Uncharacterized protein DBV15_04303 [Temnothorax longispinosus]